MGGISNTAEGTAWFSDFTIEEGSTDESNIWNFGVFLIDNVNATIEGKKQNYSMTTMEKNIVENNMQRLQNSIADYIHSKEIQTNMDMKFQYYMIIKNIVTQMIKEMV